MIDWVTISESQMIIGAAFVPEEECIYIRFKDGKCWRYSSCSSADWEEFMAPGQSRGKYFNAVLKHKPGAPFDG